ncbi:tRNA-dihydrouridine synthase [Candidatus Falkowbacteria bacterium]|nr:tRNA-dihydrouridine synthase [Candidatus Falkowbacteria bacterium]
MQNNFWQQLKEAGQPILALAPMAGVSDAPFRQMCKKYGADVVYSEMASATALNYQPAKTLDLVRFDEVERPYVVQLFGANPEHFVKATKIITEQVRPDGIDINFGCPVPKVQKQGAGAILMGNPKLAREVVEAVLDNTDLPVSIKIRARMEKGEGDAKKRIDALEFLEAMQGLELAAVMIHGRSMAQGHTGKVDHVIISQARPLVQGVLLANGGIVDIVSARTLLEETKADGLGIARGAMGRPYLFEEIRNGEAAVKSKAEIFAIALEHAELADKILGKQGILELRKHLCWYVAGFPGAAELRKELVKVESFDDVKNILK